MHHHDIFMKHAVGWGKVVKVTTQLLSCADGNNDCSVIYDALGCPR